MFVLARHGTCTTQSGQLQQSYRSWFGDMTGVQRQDMGVEINITHKALDINRGYLANIEYIGKSVCLHVCLHVCLPVCLRVCMSNGLFVVRLSWFIYLLSYVVVLSVLVCVYLCVCVCILLCPFLSICKTLATCLSVYVPPSWHQPPPLSIYISIYISIDLSVSFLSISL